jgi:UDP-2-acetamido-2,6-beta-L-arabino-hexul-4-ose reductase
MINIGITGQKGFVGTHLYNTLGLSPDKYNLIKFKRNYFEDKEALDSFVAKCNVIIHLAALNRHKTPSVIYETNMALVSSLIDSLNRTNSIPHVIISSSSQEDSDNFYGKSKKGGRSLFENWAKEKNAIFSGLIIPNVFGPFGKPNHNSVVATFSYQISNNEIPKIDIDGNLKLIYVNELVTCIINCIENKTNQAEHKVKHTSEIKVSEILKLLQNFKTLYQDNGEIPSLKNVFELNLFNTFRCYMNIKNFFPRKLTSHKDTRGTFVELIRLGIGGQVSFSKTVPGITRGNHFHTRKIERFAVIKGKALIQLRRIGTNEVLDFYLDGNEPAYVDMPVWYTHNIKNIGDDILYTNFWINETYNSEDADTFFEEV